VPLDGAGSARQDLRRLNAEFEAATIERDEAQRAVDRLSLPVTNLDKAIADLTAVRSEYERRISAWYADGCPDRRPDEPADLAALENNVRQLTGDGNAARPALADAQSALDERNALLGALGLQKASAIYRAAAEASGEHLRIRAREAMIASLMELAVAESLAAELRLIGVREPEALSAARNIERLMNETRQSVAVRPDTLTAKAFLAELAENPAAELVAPQNTEIVHLEPRTIKPMEDGSVYINRGPPEPEVKPTFPTDFGKSPDWAFTPPTGNTGLIG
jgi:chromosome segregation ATPase